jgi:perosamine synthetase
MIPPVIVPISTDEILNAFKTGITNNQTKISEFEQSISEYIGCENCILTYSGRTALYALLKAYGLKRNDEILMPAYMCETVSQLLIDMGFKLNFVDIEKDTYNISINDLNEKVNKSSRAIIAVHMFGNPCDMKGVMEIAKDHNLIVIEDAAQAMSAEYNGRKVGAIGDSGFFSFGRGKPITAIEGGAIVTNDDKIAKKTKEIISGFEKQKRKEIIAILFKLLGYSSLRNRIVYQLIHKHARNENLRKDINITNLGFKFSNTQASIGLIQLSKLDEFNRSRIENAKFLREHLNGVEGVNLPIVSTDAKPIYLRFPIRVGTESKRDKLMSTLKKSRIESSVVYPNVLPRIHGMKSSNCVNTEEVVRKMVALPTHPLVRKEDLEKMGDTILQLT